MKEIDYVEMYALNIKDNPELFKQQKKLIESQMHSSSTLFRNMFKDTDFKTGARIYLRKIGLLK
jgi:hypothetical protein